MEQVQWRINLLGRLTAEHGERRVSHFKTNKTGLLLACLAHVPRRQYRREELVEQLWPGEELEQGRNNLRVSLAFLRHALEPQEEERGALVAADRNVVYLHSDRYITDSAEFERHLALAADQSTDAERIDHLQTAIQLYHSDFLPDYEATWISGERLRLADAYHAALAKLARTHAALRQYEQALAAAQISIREDPHREEGHRLLMQILALMGRPHAALRQYRELEAMLHSDDGRPPSRRTQTVLSDLCKLSGVPEPPPAHHAQPKMTLQSTASQRFRIPAPLTSLIGREDTVVQIADLLESSTMRLVTLTGLGGVGKTRLALSVAHRLRREGRTVCYVPLEGATNCDFLLSNLANALQIREGPPEEAWDRILTLLSQAPTVLVLDNLEQLLPDAATIVRRLLEAVDNLVCLITSRQRLALTGEREFPVGPLAIPSTELGTAEVARCASVRLWLERVRTIQPHFDITPENRPAIVALCRKLDGLPLAIELAAAWSDALPPAEVTSLLDSGLGCLVSRDPSVDARHTSIKATLDWSYERLPVGVQSSFARLGVFPDGWSFAAACAVTGQPEVLDHLLALRERSLITVESSPGGPRFRMAQTVREYVLGRLNTQERASAEALLVAYYVGFAEQAEPELKGLQASEWMRRLTEEVDNLRYALRLSLREGADPEYALRLSLGLYRYWFIRSLVREGRDWLSAALDRAGETAPERPRALMALGNLAYAEGDLTSAEDYYVACQTLRAAARDTAGVAATLGNLVNIRHRRGDLPGARALAQQSLKIYERINDMRGQAVALGNLALVAKEMGDDRTTMTLGEQALDKFRSVGDLYNVMVGLANLSGAALRLGQTGRAGELLLESLDLGTQLNCHANLAHVLSGAGGLAYLNNSYALCVRLRAAAANLRDVLGIVRPPDVQQTIDVELESARLLVGDASYVLEWDAGSRMSEEAATRLVRSFLVNGSDRF